MDIFGFILPPLLGGIIALSTNWLAIKMLFRPLTEKRIFGIRVPFTPGLIPKERGRLARKLGEAISKHLLTPDVLADKLADPTIWPLPDSTIGEVLENWGINDPAAYVAELITAPTKKAIDVVLPRAIAGFVNLPQRFPALDNKLSELTVEVASKSINPIAGLFVKYEKIYTNIKDAVFTYLCDPDNQVLLREEIHKIIDNVLEAEAQNPDANINSLLDVSNNKYQDLCQRICSFHIREGAQMLFTRDPYASIIRRVLEVAATYLATHMPVADMIQKKMSDIDVAETERILLSVVGRELKLIIWLGGLFGVLIGLMSVFMQL